MSGVGYGRVWGIERWEEGGDGYVRYVGWLNGHDVEYIRVRMVSILLVEWAVGDSGKWVW